LGERRTLFAPDLVRSADEILDTLRADPVVREASELRIELPYNFADEDYEQILTDFVRLVAPALGWRRTEPAIGSDAASRRDGLLRADPVA